MPTPPPHDSSEEQSPFFPPPSTTRPSFPTTEGGSDSSITTVASFSSHSSGEGEMPYSRLVTVEHSAEEGGRVGLGLGSWDVSRGLGEEGGSQSMPPAHKSRASKEEQAEYDPSTLMVPHSAALPTPTPTTSQRHQSLPTLITSRPAPKVPSTASNGSSAPTPPPPAQASYNLSQALSLTPDSSPSLPSSPFSSSPNYYSPFPQPPPPPAGVITSMMTRSHSSTPSFSHLPSPTSSHRPGSSGTFSSTSSRPWVRDSDASSVCSGGSGSCWSEKTGAGAESEEGDGSGEVLKVAGEGVEFLDPRPEPKGASISINRTSPLHIVLHVTLPGFSLDNITVAIRRGHKVHIVADSYGAEGGHFEKLVSLGSGVSSAAPRAEFDGKELKVYVQKRSSRSGSGSNAPSIASSTEDPTSPPISPPFTASSPSSSSIDSLSLFNHNNSDTSPVPPPAATFISSPSEPPIVTRSTAEPHQRKSSKSLTGPEGAKAAAKKAREEASLRAREEAKALPKVGRRVLLSRDGGGARGVQAFGAGTEGKQQEEERPLAEPLAVPPERNGTIKARSQSPAAISPTSTVASTTSSDDSLASTSSSRSIASSHTSASSLEPSPPSSVSPSRPKFRPSNLTLRPDDQTSFRAASLAGEGASPNPSEGGGSGTGSATPKVERGESTWGFSAAVPAGGTTPKGKSSAVGEAL